MKNIHALTLAPLALCMAAPAIAQTVRQEVKPPEAQAWIDVATISGMGPQQMGGPGGPGASPMGALGSLFGGSGQSASKVSFLMTQTGAGGRYVDVTLRTRRNPQLADATQEVPPAFLTPALKLIAPRDAPVPPGETDETPHERPKLEGKISLYWGCGDTIRPGQPRVIDLATATPADLAQVFQARTATQRGVHSAQGRPHWPNPTDGRGLSNSASLVGAHQFTGNGVPEGFRFNIPAAQDLMPPMQLQQADQGGATALSWAAQPNARAVFVAGMAPRGRNEIVIWSSSEVPDMGMGLLDYQTNAAVDRWLKEKVLLAPSTTQCTVPKGVFPGEGAMLRVIAYGNELNVVHPPRPTDPKVPWEQVWAAKVRVKSVGLTMLGMPSMERAPSGQREAARESEPADQAAKEKKPSALDLLRGAIGK